MWDCFAFYRAPHRLLNASHARGMTIESDALLLRNRFWLTYHCCSHEVAWCRLGRDGRNLSISPLGRMVALPQWVH
jgi:hypothetical protein